MQVNRVGVNDDSQLWRNARMTAIIRPRLCFRPDAVHGVLTRIPV